MHVEVGNPFNNVKTNGLIPSRNMSVKAQYTLKMDTKAQALYESPSCRT